MTSKTLTKLGLAAGFIGLFYMMYAGSTPAQAAPVDKGTTTGTNGLSGIKKRKSKKRK